MINPSLTRGEYWLLETVAELCIPIWLLNSEGLELDLNKPSHGLTENLLITTLEKLFKEGLITAHRFDHEEEDLVFSAEQIQAAFTDRQPDKLYFYGLTPKGGQIWEAFARPNWNYHIDGGYQPDDDNFDIWFGEIICVQKDHLNNYFNSIVINQYDVDKKTIQWDIMEPWQATYWKKLPTGYRIRFYGREKKNTNQPPSLRGQTWYDNRWYRWR